MYVCIGHRHYPGFSCSVIIPYSVATACVYGTCSGADLGFSKGGANPSNVSLKQRIWGAQPLEVIIGC